MLTDYTDQQARMDRAFSTGGSCCQTTCEACGRTYFVTSAGHGDYSEGELEGLREMSKADPHRVIEVTDYSSVSTMILPAGEHIGKQVVIGCVCDPTEPMSTFIESNAEGITSYLREFWKHRGEQAAMAARIAQNALADLGWSSMDCAPKDGTWITVRLSNDSLVDAHFAQDLSGEEQPPFSGWFQKIGDRFDQVHPNAWRRKSDSKPPIMFDQEDTSA